MNNYDSYAEAAETILGGAHEYMRSDVSEGLTGQEHYNEVCSIINIQHTFYIVVDYDTNEAWVDHVRQGQTNEQTS